MAGRGAWAVRDMTASVPSVLVCGCLQGSAAWGNVRRLMLWVTAKRHWQSWNRRSFPRWVRSPVVSVLRLWTLPSHRPISSTTPTRPCITPRAMVATGPATTKVWWKPGR
uniref:Uncharacterized protein n=1 Tax=Escherichia coli TaxID=562 RepID=B7JCI7_ECOLX|nr:hypothetical protein pO103_94 [Escherichia coli]